MAQVELEARDAIATITLNRPDTLNSLSRSVLAELEAAVERFESDDGLAAAILTGAGRAFAAGADISEIAELEGETGVEFARRGQAVFSRIENGAKPVLAALNGFALGGGCELAMACHMRIASEKAKLGQPEVKLGIIPGFGGTQRLPRLVGRGVATQLILSGAIIPAAEALRIGLVNEVVPPDELLDRARAILAEILANGPLAIRGSLAAIRDGLDVTLAESMDVEADHFGRLCGNEEMREGTSAFLEKRDPKF